MAITPYSTPTQFQYKPLNLMAFAEPLMKMQEKYDLTKAAIEESDVKATSLQFAKDPEKARALEDLYRTKRDELVASLLESKNYTQAASKLKQLNKLYQEDPERIALESNYKTFLERDKEELARVGVGEGKITKQQYLQWREDERRKFEELGGTNFRNDKTLPGGTTYNVITGTIGRTADMSKEMQELMFKAADAIQARKFTGAMQTLGIDPTVGDAKFKVSDYENLSRAEIEAKVEDYIKQQDRFKPWLIEKADYDFKDIVYAKDEGAKYNQVAKDLLTRNYAANEQYIKNAEKLKKEKPADFNEEKYKEALLNRDFILEQIDNPDQKVIRDLFVQNEMNRQYDASALGRIFEVNNSKTSYTFRDLPSEGSGSGSGTTMFDKNGAVVNPTEYAPTYVSLEQNFNKGKTGATKAVAENNRVGGDKTFALRRLSMGEKGTALRKQMEANPALALPRQERILALFQQSKNAADFQAKLKGAGFSSDAATAKTAWNVLSNTDNTQAIATNIKTHKADYNNMEVAMDLMEQSDKEALTDKKFLGEINELGTGTHVVPESTALKFAKLTGKSVKELISMGAIEFTPARYAKEVAIPAEYKLSGNRIARLYGYQTLEQAVANGVDFKNSDVKGLTGTVNLLQKEASKRLYNAQSMGQTFSNDAAVDRILKPMVENAQQLASYKPLVGTWKGVPGFSEEGSPMAGTAIVGTPQIATRGNQTFLRVTYNYKNPVDLYGKGNLQNTVEIKIKPDQKATVTDALNRIAVNAYQNKDASGASDQVFQTAALALYHTQTKDAPTKQSARTAQVSSSNREAVLQSIPGQEGKSYEIVKRWVGEGVEPVYTARIVGPGGKQTVKVDGKELKSNDVDAIKAYMSTMLFMH
jgi:hypothetical protein